MVGKPTPPASTSRTRQIINLTPRLQTLPQPPMVPPKLRPSSRQKHPNLPPHDPRNCRSLRQHPSLYPHPSHHRPPNPPHRHPSRRNPHAKPHPARPLPSRPASTRSRPFNPTIKQRSPLLRRYLINAPPPPSSKLHHNRLSPPDRHLPRNKRLAHNRRDERSRLR